MIIEFIEKNFDDYNRKARLTPALFVSLPIALIAIAFSQIMSGLGEGYLAYWLGLEY